MKPTMHILADFLSNHSINTNIIDGTQPISGIRLGNFKPENDDGNLYLSKVFNHGDIRNFGVLCSYMNDTIRINDVTDTSKLTNELLSIFDAYKNAERDFNELIYNASSIHSLLVYASKLLGNLLIVSDTCFNYIDSTYDDSMNIADENLLRFLREGYISKELIHIMCNARYENIDKHTPYIFDDQLITNRSLIIHLFSHGKYCANLLMIESNTNTVTGRITLGKIQTLRSISRYIEKFIDHHGSQDVFKTDSHIFLSLLTDENANREYINRRLSLIGWKQNDAKCIIKIENYDLPLTASDALYTLVENSVKDSYTIIYEDSIVVVLNTEHQSKLSSLNKIITLIGTKQYYCGISYTFKNIFDIKDYYVQATIAIEYGRKNGERVSHCEHYLLPYACNILKEKLSTNIIHPSLISLLEYDEHHNTDFFNTLYEYLNNERNLIETASVLCIHRNSLVYRINKIKQMISINLDDPDIRTYLKLCFILIRNDMK